MLEKRNPIPAGARYWIDIFGNNRADFSIWIAERREAVQIEKKESFVPRGGWDWRDWYLFRTLQPVEWGSRMAMQYGWPTKAAADVQSSSDTAQTPQPASGISLLFQELSDWALPVAFGVGVYLLLKELK